MDVWIKTSDDDAFAAAKLLMSEEGLLIGGSSGSALAGTLQWLKTSEGGEIANSSGKNVVVLLPDGWVVYV